MPRSTFTCWSLVSLLAALGLPWLGGCASSRSGDAAADGSVIVRYEEPASGAPPAEAAATEQPLEVDEIGFESAPEAEELEPAEPAEPAAVDSATLLRESLEAFESAQVFWEQGNYDDAFAALDRAYQLMAEVPPDGDPFIAQEKEGMRQLISRRIIEIYASRQTTVGDMDKAIPVEVNSYVEREIASFQGPEREFFVESYRRSGLYRPMIVEELRRAGLPEQISWLPLVESGFKSRALSRARALGLWQFISSTGYRYGLERSWWIDERMDPAKSTQAAIAYLTDLHNLFGDWYLALAAYNCGEHNVLKRINSQREGYFDQFWDIYVRLPRETRRYVPRLLAVLKILEDPSAFGFDLPEPYPALEWESVEIERSAELEDLERALGLSETTLVNLNPELRRKATPAEPYELKVPSGKTEVVLASLGSLPEWVAPADTYGVHRVRRGETLSGIAGRYGTSVALLMDVNSLRSPHRIWPGQQLQVPDGGGGGSRSAAALAPGAEVTYSVRRGDNLWKIAKRYGTTVERIKRDNGLRGNTLQPGQRLVLRAGTSSAGDTYVVRKGDTLGRIAEQRGVSLNRLLQANGLSRRSVIYPGQRLWIPN